jgi:hypothetical protein
MPRKIKKSKSKPKSKKKGGKSRSKSRGAGSETSGDDSAFNSDLEENEVNQ